MLNPVPTSDCQSAREAASAHVDGELSELETARLELHLRTCVACAEYLRDVEAIAHELRTAALERPGLEIALPRRRRVPDIRVAAAAAVAVASLAAVSSSAIGHALSPGGGSAATIPTGATSSSLEKDMLSLHLPASVPASRVPLRSGRMGRPTFL